MLSVGARLGLPLGEVGRMDAEEMSLWAAYFGRHDLVENAADRRAALVCAVNANCHAVNRTFSVEDFMPQARETQTDEQVKERVRAWVIESGGRITEGRRRAMPA